MKSLLKKLFFFVIGPLSFLWIVIRLLPKPSRAAYPCMQAAAPFATAFVLYIAGLFSSVVLFKKAGTFFRRSKYIVGTLVVICALVVAVFSLFPTDNKVYAEYEANLEEPNQPMGQGVGVNPGRVVWIHEPDATDENCSNSKGDYWFQEDNTNQMVVSDMLSEALRKLTDAETDEQAWEALFRNFNDRKGKGKVGYESGERSVIKINLNTGPSGNSYERWNKETIDTSPQIVYSILDQLVNKAGVPQWCISFGDPGRNVDNLFWDKFHDEFPDVKYWGNGQGRTPIRRFRSKVVFAANDEVQDYLPTAYLEAEYMINIPVLKKHHRAGISLTSKNHFGTFVPFNGSAAHWHFSLPCAEGHARVSDGKYGMYRCFVDIMGHRDLGAKTILYLIDGIWGSTNWGHPPIKWRMAPFNDDWPSSIFLSQDPVAIESVGYDFLRTEFDKSHPTEGKYDPSDHTGPFPQYPAVDDFLHQAADKTNWPEGIVYDPEHDGTPLPASLGVHEHWNNPVQKRYSRNMGKPSGIELVSNVESSLVEGADNETVAEYFNLFQNYPNPFNPTTTISYDLPVNGHVMLEIFNALGQRISVLEDAPKNKGVHSIIWNGLNDNGERAASGLYYYKMTMQHDTGILSEIKKMTLLN